MQQNYYIQKQEANFLNQIVSIQYVQKVIIFYSKYEEKRCCKQINL